MDSHSFHSKNCPDSKGDAGRFLNILATITGIVAPLNAVPQIIKIYELKSVASVSLTTYLIVIATQLVWLTYGIRLRLRPLIISSLVVLALSLLVCLQFIMYG